ncbi:MAG: TIM-barrel domain-containing protein [Acidobacteriaceae bacterium]
MKRRECLKLIAAASAASLAPRSGGENAPDAASHRVAGFGVSAFSLGPAGRTHAVHFPRFLRAGGFSEVTPTQACLWWDADFLHAEFTNSEPDPLNLGNPGLDGPIVYPGYGRFDLISWPDAVYVQCRPNWTRPEVYVFAADSSGRCNRPDFRCEVARQDAQWTAHFQIPWPLAGGWPGASQFGVNLVRSRGQSSEVLSPAMLDQTLTLPPDLLMSAHIGSQPGIWSGEDFLSMLPDGTRRWQLPAHLIWPEDEERRWIWRNLQELGQPTSPQTLAQRVRLAQRLYNTLVLEGFSFHTDGSNWPVGPGEFYPPAARIAVNEALCQGDPLRACAVVDILLQQLSRASARWFADGSPGNIRTAQWTPVTALGSPQRDGNEIRIDAQAGKHRCSLWLSFCDGAVRLRNQNSGFFQPQQTESFTIAVNEIVSGDLRVRIEPHPWRIAVLDHAGNERWSIGRGDLSFRFSSSGEITAIDLRGALAATENLYGFGERFNALGQRGNVVTLWDVDCWDGNIHGQLNQAYKNVPLLHSTAGYSLFWNTTYRLRADIGNADPDKYRLTALGAIFDVYVWPAAPERALQSYLTLTGKPILPPRWAFEPWMGGGGRRWANGPLHNAVRQELHVVHRFRELDIPHSALYAEAGNDDPALYAGLGGTNLHVLAWAWASMDIARITDLLPGVGGKQLPVLRHANGDIAFRSEQNAIVDYTHPLAAELLSRFWEQRFELGVAGSMVDFGDMVPDDAVFYNGKRGAEMHNFYASSYHSTYENVFHEKRGGDYVQIARSGCAGDQKSICYFAGDHQANFFGMRAALRGGLNAAACGLSNWGADAGGYAGWPDPEVYIRWTEWATFCPLMRFHGTTPREPWEFGQQAVAIYKKHAWLRENLLPYIEICAKQAHVEGSSLMRPMPLAFPGIPALANCDDQYLFGPDLLIAPVLERGNSRSVYLPPGAWTDFWTGNSWRGSTVIEAATPIDRIGVFLRAGACVPLELAASLVPGDSMSGGRVKAILAAHPESGVPVRLPAGGAEYLLLYGDGTKRILKLDPHSDFIPLPEKPGAR